MFIKKFSNKTGLSIDTLRYYEKEKLLMPARNKKITEYTVRKTFAGCSYY